MAYYAKLNGTTFFNSDLDADEFILSSAELALIAGSAGSFTFAIPPCNSFYDSFHKLKDYIDVYRDEELIFSGRVYSIDTLFDTQHKIVCEGMMAILNDTIFRPVKHEGYLHSLISKIIADHNSQVESAKQITVGNLLVTDAPCYRDYQNPEKTISRLEDLVESFGGFMAIRKESNGLYLDWHNTYDSATNQAVDFGENLLDVTISEDSASIVTVLIPYGYTDDDGNTLTLGTYPNDRVTASNELIQRYGYIVGTNTWEDVTEVSNLRRKANEYITASCTPVITISVSAVDLAEIGTEYESFRIGQSIKVRSAPHQINDFFNCTEQTINILNPLSSTLTLGTSKEGFTASQKSKNTENEKAIEKIMRTYVPKNSLEEAVAEASSLITGNKGGYVVIHDSDSDGEPDEILVMNSPKIETASNIWRFNQAGIGHSTSYDGDYDVALTMNGAINASMITAGVLDGSIIKTGKIESQTGGTWWDLRDGTFYFGERTETDKSKNFTREPTTPYYIGDLWVTNKETTTAVAGYAVAGQALCGKDGYITEGGQIMVCIHTRQTGDYVSSDWVMLTNYIDTDELDGILGRLRTAEANIVANRTQIASKLDATFESEQIAINTQIESRLNAAEGLIEEKVDQTVVEGLSTTVSNLSGKFDSDGSLIEYKAGREEIDEAIAEKSKVFRSTPEPPYMDGDLWVTSQSDTMNGYVGTAVAGKAIAGFGADIYITRVSRDEDASFEFTDWYKSADYASSDQLKYAERRIKNAELAIDAVNASIAMKADYTVVNEIGTRVNEVGIELDAQRGEIESRVKNTDYTGATIASKINQSASTIAIEAQHINLNGAVTANEYFKVNTDGSVEIKGGTIDIQTTAEKLDKIVLRYDNRKISINPTGVTVRKGDYHTGLGNNGLFVQKEDKYYISLGVTTSDSGGIVNVMDADGVVNIQLKGEDGSIYVRNGLFRVVRKQMTATLIADASAQYYAEGSIVVNPEDGYEVVGLGGYYATVANTSSNASCINVYRAAYFDGRFHYGFCNTGAHDQDVTLYYYILEARTKGTIRTITE